MTDLVSNSHSTPISSFVGNLPTYEEMMSQDLQWAFTQGSIFFEGRGYVQESLRRITKRLNEAGISYAVADAAAMYLHGFRRYFEVIHILVTKPSARRIYESLDRRGYIRPFALSKHLRDAESGVKIELLLSGDYPGDGKPKELPFPDPDQVSTLIGDVRCLKLPTLIELKLCSGMTSAGRYKDLADVQELIRMLGLPLAFGEQLNPYVRAKFDELRQSVESETEESS